MQCGATSFQVLMCSSEGKWCITLAGDISWYWVETKTSIPEHMHVKTQIFITAHWEEHPYLYRPTDKTFFDRDSTGTFFPPPILDHDVFMSHHTVTPATPCMVKRKWVVLVMTQGEKRRRMGRWRRMGRRKRTGRRRWSRG